MICQTGVLFYGSPGMVEITFICQNCALEKPRSCFTTLYSISLFLIRVRFCLVLSSSDLFLSQVEYQVACFSKVNCSSGLRA